MKKTLFWMVYALLLTAATVGGLELLSTFITPSWPAFELRPLEATMSGVRQIKTLADAPQSVPTYNSWGLKDRERSIDRPPGIHFRSAIVGDSFVEGVFAIPPVTEDIEEDWADSGIKDMEAVNLGISATGPPQYYYRIKQIALRLHPDVVVLVFYSGNDFVRERLVPWSMPPFVAERPEPSLLGAVAPHLTWLAVNRLALSEWGHANKNIPNEFDIVNDILKKPRDERGALLAKHLKKYYYPDKDEAVMREILSRGGDRFWDAFERTDSEREFLMGWMIAIMVDVETGTWPVPHDAAEADRMVDQREIDGTMSWLVGAKKLVEASGAKFLLAVAPMASVDPRVSDFWKPWPRYYSWNISREATRRRLDIALREKGITPIDLSDDLAGVSGSYRLTDGHWTALGTSIVAKRLERELLKIRNGSRSARR